MPKHSHKINRRKFLVHSASLAAGSVVATNLSSLAARSETAAEFRSAWDVDRVWLGAEYWANPLQDWRVAGGRIECVNAAPDRNVHLLTRQLAEGAGDLQMSVRVGRTSGALAGRGSFGFRVGILGPLREYRNNLATFGTGLNCGVTASGGLFIGAPGSAAAHPVELRAESVELRLSAVPAGANYRVTLAVHDAAYGQLLAEMSRDDIAPDQLVGNVALVANYGGAQQGPKARNAGGAGDVGTFWFADWQVSGTKLEAHDDRAFGPILFNHYTLSRGVLKMTAQMPPLGAQDSRTVKLETKKAGAWTPIGEEKIHPDSRTATFRIPDWNDREDAPYRLAYSLGAREHTWTGTVRKDPVDAPVLTVADVSCNVHAAFPNAGFVANMAALNPDLLAFVGDQFYENTGGYGVRRDALEPAMLDYLRKWFFHGWTWRELTRDRPSLSLPDDHDVYQGNLWGEGGAGRKTTQEAGGYDMPVEWVNVVHRTQTSHHPDPYDREPCKRGTSNYYGPLTYGRVSFAVLADRQYKSGPEGKVPPTGDRGDHVINPDFDPATADIPGAHLLGERQMQFLREWAADWYGAEMKAVISQTIFTGMATTHGGQREILRADYDANGWPQTPRNAALREIRKAFAFHLAGDQHLPALLHYGVDAHGDGAVAFAGPAVNVGYPRWWEPAKAKWTGGKPGAELIGDFTDAFGHPMTVLAVANGAYEPRKPVLDQMHDKSSGLGLVRFDKARRSITIECWPFLADPMKPGTQFPGWPVTIDALANYGRKPAAHLPTLKVAGVKNPVVQIFDEAKNEILYTLRLAGQSFRAPVFAPGLYSIRVSEPETGKMKTLARIAAQEGAAGILEVEI